MFPFKKSLLSLLCWIVLLAVSTSYAGERAKPADDVLRVLAIGNSFSQDAVEQYLHELAAAAGKKMVIGNLYIGGAPLKLHVENVQANKPAYSYRKIDVDGNKTKTDKTSILTALQDESWDYISFQQASTFSGVYDTYAASLPALYQYVKNQVSAKTKYILHQTWALSKAGACHNMVRPASTAKYMDGVVITHHSFFSMTVNCRWSTPYSATARWRASVWYTNNLTA